MHIANVRFKKMRVVLKFSQILNSNFKHTGAKYSDT